MNFGKKLMKTDFSHVKIPQHPELLTGVPWVSFSFQQKSMTFLRILKIPRHPGLLSGVPWVSGFCRKRS
jgi:hypothetical protein